uniref:Uncharacterized protein n=1 Tax=Macrostomum lignano TaxID=282301 RepID=A0A1I8G9R1_9PLAT
MGSVPGHPFFAFVARRMQAGADEGDQLAGGGGGGKPKATSAYVATGPGMLTEAYREWQLRRQPGMNSNEDVVLLGWDFFSGFVESRADLWRICRARFGGIVNGRRRKRPRGRRSMSFRICRRILRTQSWKREESTTNTIAFHRFMHLGYPENQAKIWGVFNVTMRFPRISFYYH